MPRRNSGPRLRFLDKRQSLYICWTENGRSRERGTGTADRKQPSPNSSTSETEKPGRVIRLKSS